MKLILITVVGLLVGMMAACSGGSDGGGIKFANAQEVVDSFNEFDLQDCHGMLANMVGADSGLSCEVEPGVFESSVEVYVFDGDAEALCNKDEFCQGLSGFGAMQFYLGNVMLVVYHDLDFGNDLVEDLKK